jgi:phosphatidylserine/phosphatidylglycerophosphate/cardiolipin synthase-like enzyme
MRKETTKDGRKVVAISSEHTVALAMGWPQHETKDLLGFAIRKHNPDGTTLWLENLLGFKGQVHVPGEPIPSSEAPIQKMYWSDYKVRPGNDYGYDVIPVYGTPDALELHEDRAVQLEISTETNAGQKNQVYFNRAVIASQAYVRNFGLVPPDSDPRILAWLARGLDEALLNFIARAHTDKTMRLDVAAYHFDHPQIVAALKKVGKRARVSLAWKSSDDRKRNADASRILKKAGVSVHHRQHVRAISHNKYIISKDGAGNPTAVLMGSTNFTVGGVSLQNNVSHIIENKELAEVYLKNFELVFDDDNAGLIEADGEWTGIGPSSDIEINFSPHASGERIDLDRYVELVENAASSIFFATFRATDASLITALTAPKKKTVVARGLVDKVYEQGAGEVILYHAAHEKDPAVVPATSVLRAVDPLSVELARKGFSPLVHHKFILLDYNTPDCVVITGSANYSKNSSEKNDENTLILHRDQRVAQMYFGEFARIYEHYRARWFLYVAGEQAPNELYLKPDGRWASKYYGDSQSARFLQVALM